MTLFDSGNLEPRELLPGDGSMVYHRGFYSLMDSDVLMAELFVKFLGRLDPLRSLGAPSCSPGWLAGSEMSRIPIRGSLWNPGLGQLV